MIKKPMEATPRESVSVIIPAYNAAPFVAETLDSVFRQTAAIPFEVVVVNDGSPDTPALELALEPYLSRIRVLSQTNQGPSAARNAGIRASSAPLVAFLDADDLWEPDFIERQIELLVAGADLVWGNATYFGDGDWVGQRFMDLTPHPAGDGGTVTLTDLLARRAVVNTSTLLTRRNWLERGGLFPEQYRYNEDLYLWLRMAQAGARLRWTRRVLARFRRHAGGNLTANRLAMWDQLAAVHLDLERELELSAEEREASRETRELAEAHVALERGRAALLESDPAAADLLARAASHFRSPKLAAVAWAARWCPGILRRVAAGTGRI